MRKPQQFKEHPVSFSEALSNGLFRGYCENAVDGDTVDVFLDCGFHQYAYAAIRLVRINADELTSPDPEQRERAVDALNFVQAHAVEMPVLVESTKQKKSFSRFVGDVFIFFVERPMFLDSRPIKSRTLSGMYWRSLSDILLTEGLVTEYQK